MQKVTPMIGKRYSSHGRWEYFMKNAICRNCGKVRTVQIAETRKRCTCGQLMIFKWVSQGYKLDYTEYFAQEELK